MKYSQGLTQGLPAVGLTALFSAGALIQARAMRGEDLREFRGDFGEVAVRLAFRENDRQSVEQLADLPLYTPEGRRVTLGSVASLHVARAPDAIKRSDRQTAVILSANLEDETNLEDVKPASREKLDRAARAILDGAANPLVQRVDTMDGAAERAAELAAAGK